jgi:hypothetical protein
MELNSLVNCPKCLCFKLRNYSLKHKHLMMRKKFWEELKSLKFLQMLVYVVNLARIMNEEYYLLGYSAM